MTTTAPTAPAPAPARVPRVRRAEGDPEAAAAALTAALTARVEAAEEARRRDAVWRDAVLAAMRSGMPVTEVARTAGITRRRVYQIADGGE